MNREEILAAYASGRRDFSGLAVNEFLDLSALNLVDADFSDAGFDASFDDSDLRQAKFVNAYIKKCSFVRADLRGADFRGAGICAADFTGANLEGALFAGTYQYSYTLSPDDRPTLP
jgi:uncharacterized protein YjbI with pentapeptide repeats